MNKDDVLEYVKNQYGTKPEYPWEKYPTDLVLKHENNRKWYGLIMDVHTTKLGLQDDKIVQILNVKCPPEMIGGFRKEEGFFPAYHMNKEHWITILLDGTVKDDTIKGLIDLSYELTWK